QVHVAARNTAVDDRLHAPRGNGDVVARVVDERDAVQELMRGAEAVRSLEPGGDRRNARESGAENLDLARGEGVGELPGVRQVPAERRVDADLLIDVNRLVDLEGVVADAVEARRAAAVVQALDRQGEGRLAQQARLVDRVERALDFLLAAADDRPLG